MKSTMLAFVMTLSLIPCVTAQVLAPRCGGEGDPPCQFFSAEMWANDSGPCDRGLKNSTDNLEFFIFGKSGTCVNDNRRTVNHDSSWAGWALHEQRNGVQGNLPINAALTLGTHNSFSNIADGDRNAISTNQYYSITDQLQLGARYIRIDPVFYFGQLRTCHSSPFDDGKITNADVCIGLAGLSTVGLANFFTPLIVGLNTAPPPIPEALDALLTASAIYGATNPINNRLFAYTIKEVANWLNSNPGEVIMLLMYEADSTQHGSVNKVIQTYLGGKVFTPADFGNAGQNWPSISQLRQMNKQVIIFNDNGATVDDAYSDPWSFQRDYHGKQSYIARPNAPDKGQSQCVVEGTPMADYKKNNPKLFLGTGEGRTGADFLENHDFSGTMDESGVATAVQCGASSISLDFWLGLDHAIPGFSRTGPDTRREAAIWSYAQDDFGKGGPASLSSSSGRWNSVPPATTLYYACAYEPKALGPRNMYEPRKWQVAGPGDFFGAGYTIDSNGKFTAQSDICSRTYNADWVFAAPETFIENQVLQSVMKEKSISSGVWLKYSATKIPPAGFAGSSEAYMSRAGAPPDLNVKIAGFSDVNIKLAVRVNEHNILDSGAIPLELTTQFTSLADGEISAGLAFNATAVQALPSGAYAASIELLTQTKGQNSTISVGTLPITLHIQEPTTTDLTKSTSTDCPAGKTCLAARVAPLCTFAKDAESGDTVGITGGVTFTDTVLDAAGIPVVTILGTVPINNHPDQASDNDNGVVHPLNNGCGNDVVVNSGVSNTNNTVCAWVDLPGGPHSLSAQYNRDSTYNSSGSSALNVDIANAAGTPAAPAVVDLGIMSVGGSAPKGKWTLPAVPNANFQIRGGAPFIVTPGTGSLGTDATVTVSVDPSAPAGNYSVTLICDAVFQFTTVHNVYLATATVSIRSPLTTTTSSLRFSYLAQVHPVPPAAQQITLSSVVPQPVRVQTTTENGADWLKALANGDSSNPISVSVNGYGLAAGTYKGTVIALSSGPGSQPVQVPVELDVTYSGIPALVYSNPPGMKITVDGIEYVTPAAFMGEVLAFPQVTAPSGYVSLGPGRRAIFTNWAANGTRTEHTVLAFFGQTATANFQVQYELTTNVFPACSGTISPSGGWYNQGDSHFMTATPVDQFQVQPGQEVQGVIFNSPKTVNAQFICPTGQACNHAGGPFTRVVRDPLPNGTGWNNSFPNITLMAAKPGGIVQSVQYSLSGAQERAATITQRDQVGFPVTAEGITAVTYFATDSLGNREPASTFTVKFDHTPPVITPTFTPAPNSFGWANTNVKVQFNCSDSLSGVAGSPVVVDATTEGISTVTGGCSDNAGNAAQSVAKVGIERTIPTITVSPLPLAISPTDGATKIVTVIGSFKAISGAETKSFTALAKDSTGTNIMPAACDMIPSGDFKCDFSFKTSPPGSAAIEVRASSKAGNSVFEITKVTVNK